MVLGKVVITHLHFSHLVCNKRAQTTNIYTVKHDNGDYCLLMALYY